MSYSIRDRAQRKLKQASANVDTAMTYLLEVAETYEAEHPEVSEPCKKVAQILLVGEEAIQELRGLF